MLYIITRINPFLRQYIKSTREIEKKVENLRKVSNIRLREITKHRQRWEVYPKNNPSDLANTC